MSVQVKLGSILSEPIQVCKGIRQVAYPHRSCLTFFYQYFVNECSQCTGGSNINTVYFNIFCYADNLLLASLTFSGLQHLIYVANKYIQSAYRTGHSTETALLKVHHDIAGALDRKCMAALVLLDLSAAFDIIDRLE